MRRHTFERIALEWEKFRKPFVKQTSFATYKDLLANHLLPEFGKKRRIDQKDIQSFVAKKMEEGYSKKTVVGMLTLLKGILRFGATEKMCAFPVWNQPLLPASRPRCEVMSWPDRKKIVRYCLESGSIRDAGICISIMAGLRIGEVCALQWKDVDFRGRLLYVRQSVQRLADDSGRTRLRIVPTKTNTSEREIPLTRLLCSYLSSFAPEFGEESFILGGTDRPVDPRTYRNHFSRTLERLDIPHVKFQGLRHTFATSLIESGCDTKTASSLLGHSSVNITLNLYVHPDLEHKVDCLDRMEAFLRR